MILLELFAGTRSIGKTAEKSGIDVYSLEIDPVFKCNLTMDILDFNPIEFYNKYGVPDIIWASPDCTSFSIAACSHHRKDGIAISEKAKLGDRLLDKTLYIIHFFNNINPNLIYYIENPRGLMRKQSLLLEFLESHNGRISTVTYCQYGDNRMKPTDIFNNNYNWIPRPMCKNGDKCHEAAPRGSRTGTQGLKGSKLRSVIPIKLCEEVIKSCS